MAGSCLEDVNDIIDSVSHRHQYESLKEEQKKVILNFIDGRDLCVPSNWVWKEGLFYFVAKYL